MGAMATLRIPLGTQDAAGARLACETAYLACGTWAPAWDARASELSVQIQFPGNITALVGKLTHEGFDVPARIGISLPLRSIASPDTVTDSVLFLQLLASDPSIFEPRLEGDRVIAQIKPNTYAAHAIYDHCIEVGLMPQDVPTLPSLRGL
jgi:hypothetical protein